METTIYCGTKYYVQSSGRYYQSRQPVNGERLLHRRVWADACGPIAPGIDVHHRDEDWRNNVLDNLEARPASEHRTEHLRGRWSDPAQRKVMEAGRLKAIVKAPEWHASEAGTAWHREHGKATWATRQPVDCTCATCGAAFKAMWPRAKHCSKRCTNAFQYKKRMAKQQGRQPMSE